MRRHGLGFLVVLIVLAASCPEAAEAHNGYGIVVDPQGRICFLDSVRNRIWRVEPDARLTSLATDKHGNNLARDAAGNLYVQHVNRTIWKISPDDRAIKLLQGPSVGSLDEFITVDNAGNIYLAVGNDFHGRPPRLLKRTATGSVSELGAGFGVLISAAWGPDGSLYLTERTRIRRLAPDGNVSTVAEGFQRLMGIAVDTQGTFYVADSDAFAVLRVAPDGRSSVIARTWLPWKPAAVAVRGEDVFILERMFVPLPIGLQQLFRTHRIRQISSDGRQSTLVTVGRAGDYVVLAALLGMVSLVYRWRTKRKAAKARATTAT